MKRADPIFKNALLAIVKYFAPVLLLVSIWLAIQSWHQGATISAIAITVLLTQTPTLLILAVFGIAWIIVRSVE